MVDSKGSASNYSYRPPAPTPTPIDPKLNQFSIQMIDGGSAKIADLVGNNKVVVINLWATWCPPCRREIPELVAIQEELKDKGLEVVGLTVEDPVNDRERVNEAVKELSINYKIGFSSPELYEVFNGPDPAGPIPQTFIFGRNGQLVDRMKGFRPHFRAWVEGAVNHALNN